MESFRVTYQALYFILVIIFKNYNTRYTGCAQPREKTSYVW